MKPMNMLTVLEIHLYNQYWYLIFLELEIIVLEMRLLIVIN